MGEVVISSYEVEVRRQSEVEDEVEENKKKVTDEEEVDEFEETHSLAVKNRKVNDFTSSRNGLMFRWEKLIPRMALRILLVEADDSTRQIIGALLRKCSYKVVAVNDGLKAWEIIKGRPNNVDLILTEVDLPSISGYALLTLIMEHEICKRIPVIMMSSHDSISTVYKCMLRGASDYLVKPIRRNELRNLWQHVWRRQSALAGVSSPHDESVGQDKVEATSENNTASNNSNRDLTHFQNNKECIEKGSDAQSSCTKPDAEAESTHLENMHDFVQPVWGKTSSNDRKNQNHEAHREFSQKTAVHENEAEGSAAAFQVTDRIILDDDAEPQSQGIHYNTALEASDNNYVPISCSRKAIDFMGTSACHNFSKDTSKSKFEFSPRLDLCLTRYGPSGFEFQNTDKKCNLRPSNASAFSRYTGRPFQPGHLTMASVSNQKELEANSGGEFSGNLGDCNSDIPGPSPSTERSIISLSNGQTGESKIANLYPPQIVFPMNNSSNALNLNNLCTSYGSIFSPFFGKQSGTSPTSTSSGNHLEPNPEVNPFCQSTWRSNSENLREQLCESANDSVHRFLQNQDHKLESLEDRGHISPTTDQSTTSSLCNGGASHLNMGYRSTSGSNSNFDQAANTRAASERKEEDGILNNSQRSIQREAALNKFRLKRKDRCFEKKVRYESRKKLAEQRPRVKGQFVRQVALLPAETVQNHHNTAVD